MSRSLDTRCAYFQAGIMPKTIQILNVPEEVYREIEALAAAQGKTISQYLLDLARPKKLDRAEIEAFMNRVRSLPREESDFDVTAYIRQERDSH